jgi:hypothetical protein
MCTRPCCVEPKTLEGEVGKFTIASTRDSDADSTGSDRSTDADDDDTERDSDNETTPLYVCDGEVSPSFDLSLPSDTTMSDTATAPIEETPNGSPLRPKKASNLWAAYKRAVAPKKETTPAVIPVEWMDDDDDEGEDVLVFESCKHTGTKQNAPC